MRIGWSWTAQIGDEPRALPAWRQARHAGASEHSSSSGGPPAISVNPVAEDFGASEHDVVPPAGFAEEEEQEVEQEEEISEEEQEEEISEEMQ